MPPSPTLTHLPHEHAYIPHSCLNFGLYRLGTIRSAPNTHGQGHFHKYSKPSGTGDRKSRRNFRVGPPPHADLFFFFYLPHTPPRATWDFFSKCTPNLATKGAFRPFLAVKFVPWQAPAPGRSVSCAPVWAGRSRPRGGDGPTSEDPHGGYGSWANIYRGVGSPPPTPTPMVPNFVKKWLKMAKIGQKSAKIETEAGRDGGWYPPTPRGPKKAQSGPFSTR